MNKTEFKKETFGFPVIGESGFISASIYGKKYKNIHIKLHELKRLLEQDSDPLFHSAVIEHIWKLWKKAKNVTEFKSLILNDEVARKSSFAVELLKNDVNFWYFLRSIIGAKQFKTYSEIGSVKVGDGKNFIFIRNGMCDGLTRCAIFDDSKEFNPSAFTYITRITGEYNIYSNDCGDEVAKTISGNYSIYSNDGFVCFVKEKW